MDKSNAMSKIEQGKFLLEKYKKATTPSKIEWAESELYSFVGSFGIDPHEFESWDDVIAKVIRKCKQLESTHTVEDPIKDQFYSLDKEWHRAIRLLHNIHSPIRTEIDVTVDLRLGY